MVDSASASAAPGDDWPLRAREAFLDALWGLVVVEDGASGGGPAPWLAEALGGSSAVGGSSLSVRPAGDAEATALHRVLACGVDPDDLTDVVREMQHEVIYNLCQLLDDPGLLGIGLDGEDPQPPEFRWHLAATRTAAPTASAPLHSLHTALDTHDPSGREGDPRGRPLPASLPGHPAYVRLAVAQARAGDRMQAIKTWREATGLPAREAKVALDRVLGGAE